MAKEILYNVTVKIDNSAEDNWLNWMKSEHIPKVLNTGCFINCRMSKMLFLDDIDGQTYSIQYLCRDMSILNQYFEKFANQLRADVVKKFDGKFVAFRSIMEVEEEIKLN